MSDVFLLGCERSGSTWLANIFDSHPDVELWMEPFADYAGLFPEVPDRNSWVGEATPELAAAVREGYARLPGLKYPLLHRPGGSVQLRRIEQALLRSARRWLRRGLRMNLAALERYELLQLNALETPVSQLTRKRAAPGCQVTKELRLNFKVGLLCGCFPEARFIVAVRHPGAQLASIMRWMERGRLGELARALTLFEDRVREQKRLAPFAKALADLPSAGTREGRLAAWWAINYSVLLGDLEAGGAKHRVVHHERFSEAPANEVTGLLAFAGLATDAAVDRYLAWSTGSAPRSESPTETVRRSAQYARDAIRKVGEPVRSAVAAVLARLREAGLLHAGLGAGIEA